MVENRIKEYRLKLGMSQTELARRARIASPNLSNIERGRLAPWPRIEWVLARVLKTTPAELFPISKT